MQGVVELTVAGHRGPSGASTAHSEGLHRRRTGVGSEVGLEAEAPHVAYGAYDPGGRGRDLSPRISVRLVPEASTSASMRSFRSAIFRSSVRTSRSTSEASPRRTREEEPCGRMPRRMRAARAAESLPATPPGTRSRRSRSDGQPPWCALQPGPLASWRAGAAPQRRPRGSALARRSLPEAAKAVASA